MSTYLVKYDLTRGLSPADWDADDHVVRSAARRTARQHRHDRTQRLAGWLRSVAIQPTSPADSSSFAAPIMLPF